MIADQDFSSFGSLLKNFRARKHLTQQQLGKAIGVHRNAIGRWEQGDFLPANKALVLELAKHLHLDDQETRHLLEASLTALSPYWMVPLPRNPFFTGREEVLDALHSQLGVNQAVALTQSSALHGLGGIGKTQIAIEYAYRHALEYSAVLWVGAETEEQIISSLLGIADVLQLPERDDKDQQRVIAAVQRWLTTHNQWLLIWDNMEDLNVLDRFLPPVRSGAMLITTRSRTLGTLARGVDLLPMEHEEGLLFLLRRAKVLTSWATHQELHQLAEQMPSQYTAAADLVTVMGGLPLALDQAGAYLEETQCGLSVYLNLFRTRRTILLQQRGEKTREHPTSVSATFALAIASTAQRHPAVSDLLRVCALLQPDAIPEELFCRGAEYLGSPLASVCRDELEWNRAVGVACSYSLLSRQFKGQTLSIHRLVQAFLLDGMTETEQEQWAQQALRALDAVFPEVLPITECAIWTLCERLLPHALLCLHRVGVANESLTFASLAYKTAQYLRERGQYAEAEPFFQKALSIREQNLGSDHPDVAITLNYFAILYRRQGKYTEAEPLFQRALSIREQRLGPDHPDVAITLNNLAGLYWMQGRYAEAEAFYHRTVLINEQSLSSNHPQVAQALTNLAGLYLVQGKYAEAEPLLHRAILINEQSLSSNHPQVAQTLTNLAGLYLDQGKYAEAEPLFQRALHLREQRLGPDHPDVAVTLNNLAELYLDQGKYAEAELLFQRALHLREQRLGSDHPHVAQVLNYLARLYLDQGKYAEAEPLFLQSLHLREQHLGPDHPDIAESLNGLAILFQEQGHYVEAEALFQRSLFIREMHLGQQHPETAQILYDLAVFRQKQGKLSEAISFAERALSIRSQSLGDAHKKTIITQALHTQFVQKQEYLEEEAVSSGQQSGSQTMARAQEQLPIAVINVAVRGATDQIAYTRNVRMREVTFTCTICGQTVTQQHYPSGRIKYCSEACRVVNATQMQQQRVIRQREKRQQKREQQDTL